MVCCVSLPSYDHSIYPTYKPVTIRQYLKRIRPLPKAVDGTPVANRPLDTKIWYFAAYGEAVEPYRLMVSLGCMAAAHNGCRVRRFVSLQMGKFVASWLCLKMLTNSRAFRQPSVRYIVNIVFIIEIALLISACHQSGRNRLSHFYYPPRIFCSNV